MKKIFIIIALLATSILCADAQVVDDIYGDAGSDVKLEMVTPAKQVKETKQERKQREKELRALNDSVAHNRAVRGLQNGRWVLLADRITVGRTAYTVYNIDSNANFLLQQDKDGMVQVAYNRINPGVNGLGGITLQGKVGGVRMETDKKGNITYSYSLSSTEISAHVTITVFAGSGNAQAFVDSTFGPGSLTIYGKLVPYNHSKH
ncbi:MAG: DUF4251 domain-containing protein [Muribaculaceae bacterium]|nr:DUF4251 domain-containing protein [Muribaculaceae bacterium]